LRPLRQISYTSGDRMRMPVAVIATFAEQQSRADAQAMAARVCGLPLRLTCP